MQLCIKSPLIAFPSPITSALIVSSRRGVTKKKAWRIKATALTTLSDRVSAQTALIASYQIGNPIILCAFLDLSFFCCGFRVPYSLILCLITTPLSAMVYVTQLVAPLRRYDGSASVRLPCFDDANPFPL